MLRGLLTTAYCAAKGSLLSAVGAGPHYSLTMMQPIASRGLAQVRWLVQGWPLGLLSWEGGE